MSVKHLIVIPTQEKTVTVTCGRCVYCKTGERQYCDFPSQLTVPCTVPCRRCYRCRVGEIEDCMNAVRYALVQQQQ